jgi:hypothetical protein
MSHDKARHPDPSERDYVSALVDRHGLSRAARHLGLSRLATLNVAHGGVCYPSTLRQVNSVRLARPLPLSA